MAERTGEGAAPLSLYEALHGIWKADKYAILGNEDWREGAPALMRKRSSGRQRP